MVYVYSAMPGTSFARSWPATETGRLTRPRPLAPFEVELIALNPDVPAVNDAAEKLYAELGAGRRRADPGAHQSCGSSRSATTKLPGVSAVIHWKSFPRGKCFRRDTWPSMWVEKSEITLRYRCRESSS
jgi:hypothetical protein